MKKFETPMVEIEKFEIADVITTSGDEELGPCTADVLDVG